MGTDSEQVKRNLGPESGQFLVDQHSVKASFKLRFVDQSKIIRP